MLAGACEGGVEFAGLVTWSDESEAEVLALT